LKRQFVPYLQAGLLLGERCFYFFGENTTQFVIDAMQENGFDLKPYLDSGAFLVIKSAEVQLRGGFFSGEKMTSYWAEILADAQKAGFTALRVALDVTGGLAES